MTPLRAKPLEPYTWSLGRRQHSPRYVLVGALPKLQVSVSKGLGPLVGVEGAKPLAFPATHSSPQGAVRT